MSTGGGDSQHEGMGKEVCSMKVRSAGPLLSRHIHTLKCKRHRSRRFNLLEPPSTSLRCFSPGIFTLSNTRGIAAEAATASGKGPLSMMMCRP